MKHGNRFPGNPEQPFRLSRQRHRINRVIRAKVKEFAPGLWPSHDVSAAARDLPASPNELPCFRIKALDVYFPASRVVRNERDGPAIGSKDRFSFAAGTY